MRHKLTLAYDGTDFSGWQRQKGTRTIQETIEDALFSLMQKKIHVCGAGRTDAGVHALAQTAHIVCEKEAELLWKALNALLPPDLRVMSVETVPEYFHARFSAKKKHYRYEIDLSRTPNPLQKRFVFSHPQPLDDALFCFLANRFCGTHDFVCFANHRSGEKRGDTVRTIYECRVEKKDTVLTFDCIGEGFLYKMVRNMVGVLIECATDKRTVESFESLFSCKERRLGPNPAPAHGLTLVEVMY